MIKSKIYCIDFGDEKALFRLDDQNKEEKKISIIALHLASCNYAQKDFIALTQILPNSYFKQYKNCIKEVLLKDLPLCIGWRWLSSEFMELFKRGLNE
jgi:hypothetical protein